MFKETVSRLLDMLLAGFLISIIAQPVWAGRPLAQDAAVRDVSFSLTRLPENPKQYSLVLSDPDERSISGVFSIDQLQVLKAIMTEAEKFALSEEAVGAREPIVTRFADKQEQSFLVDVEKLGNQSRLFVTINSEIGRMTADAGRINRTVRREEGFFFDLLARLQSELPKLPAPPK